jgi:hypothetical protein
MDRPEDPRALKDGIASCEEIKAAPEFDERRLGDRAYLEKIGWHYRQDEPTRAPSGAADTKQAAAG